MTDIIATIGNSVVQHGPNSSRVYLMKLDPSDLPGLHDNITKLVDFHGYGKVFAKVPASAAPDFLQRGYREEARIPGYYGGHEDAVLLGLYHDAGRQDDYTAEQTAKVLESALSRRPAPPPPPIGRRHARQLTPQDIPALARLYRETFDSYPFPITEPDYLARTMDSHVDYFGVLADDRLISASSAEMDRDALAVEMTDFATASAFRGQGLARGLLAEMDAAMRRLGMLTAYTIARSVSFGMNITFARGGYRFGGTLINNTGISGAIESMNVWHRSL